MSLCLGLLISKMRVIIIFDGVVKNTSVDIPEAPRAVPGMELALKNASYGY